MSARAVAVDMAKLLEGHGYRLMFPPGRNPAVFKVIGLDGRPRVEVTAEDNGQAACHYTGRSAAEAARVIARLPVPGQHQDVSAPDTVTVAWDGIEIEWHHQSPAERPADPRQMTASLLAQLAFLNGRDDRKDDRGDNHQPRRSCRAGRGGRGGHAGDAAIAPDRGKGGGQWLSCC